MIRVHPLTDLAVLNRKEKLVHKNPIAVVLLAICPLLVAQQPQPMPETLLHRMLRQPLPRQRSQQSEYLA